MKRRVVNEIRLDDSSKTRDVNRSITGLCLAYLCPFGHIVYLWPEQHHLRPSGARVLRGTNYVPDKRRDYHYYQYIRLNRTNLLHKERLLT